MTNVFAVAATDFKLAASSMEYKLRHALTNALAMLESYQSGMYRTNDDLPRYRRVATVHEFLENHPHFSGYLKVVHNHPIDYVGNVGHVFMDAIPGSGFCGSITLVFIAE
jgi:hypothetical protein